MVILIVLAILSAIGIIATLIDVLRTGPRRIPTDRTRLAEHGRWPIDQAESFIAHR